METFLFIVTLLAGPIVGALIGILTNYIAVKMLFHPYTEKHIGKLHVPFTPGIVPRRQAALAAALGKMVGETLVRREDIKRALCSDEVSGAVVGGILSLPPIRSSGEALIGSTYDVQRDRILNAATDRIVLGISSLDLAGIFTKEGVAAISSTHQKNPLIAMFLNENTIAGVAGPLAERVRGYLEGDGKLKIKEMLEAELAKIEEKPIGEMLGDKAQMEPLLKNIYLRLVEEHADAIAARFHIDKIVEQRVSAMQPKDLEDLILSVMKKELGAVIRLGAVIGFVMGLITTLTNFI